MRGLGGLWRRRGLLGSEGFRGPVGSEGSAGCEKVKVSVETKGTGVLGFCKSEVSVGL